MRKMLLICCIVLLTLYAPSLGQDKELPETEHLLHLLKTSKDPIVRQQALEKLEPVEDRTVVDTLCDLLHEDSSEDVRIDIAHFLGHYTRNPKVFRALRKTLTSDESYWVRCGAADSLGKVEHNEASHVLTTVLDKTLQIALSKSTSYEDLIGVEALAYSICNSLGKLHATSAVSVLVRVLKKMRRPDNTDKSAFSTARYAAAHALWRIGDPAAIPALVYAIKADPDEDVVQGAIGALGGFPEEKAAENLIWVLENEKYKEVSLRKEAIIALSRLQADQGVNSISKIIRSDNRDEIRALAAYVMGYYSVSDEVRKSALSFIFHNKDCSPTTQCIAAKSLAELGVRELKPEIEKRLANAEGENRILLQIACILLGDNNHVKELENRFVDNTVENIYLHFELPFFLLRNGYLTKKTMDSLSSLKYVVGAQPIFQKLQKLFPEAKQSRNLVRTKDLMEYWRSLREFVRTNMDQLSWDKKKRCYILESDGDK